MDCGQSGGNASTACAAQVDIGAVLDQGAFTLWQRMITVLIALAIVLDGFDSQLLGFAVPLMMKDWGLPREAFTFAIAASPVGMVAGSIVSGLLADKIGRRGTILLTLAVCGTATLLIGTAGSVEAVAVYRFFAGFGIGGALPVCTTMSAEFAPARYRTMIITASIVCVPLGGMLAGVFSGFFLYTMGWRFVFYAGGLLPLVFLLLLWFTLPESPRFLARHRRRWEELRKLLKILGRPVAENAVFTEVAGQAAQQSRGGMVALLQRGYTRDTLAVWGTFFCCMLAIYAVFGWLPAILAAEGISGAVAGYGLTVYNLGGVAGAVVCAWGALPVLVPGGR